LPRRKPIRTDDNEFDRWEETGSRPALERVRYDISKASRRSTVARLIEQRSVMRGGQPKRRPICLIGVAIDVRAPVLELLHPTRVSSEEGIRIAQFAPKDEERRLRRDVLGSNIMVALRLTPPPLERGATMSLSDGGELGGAVLEKDSIVLLNRIETPSNSKDSDCQRMTIISRGEDVAERGDRSGWVDWHQHKRPSPSIRLREVDRDERGHRVCEEEQVLQVDATPVRIRRLHYHAPLLMRDIRT
jgi:hypothetical protein